MADDTLTKVFRDFTLKQTILPDGTKEWRNDQGRLHGVNFPARELPDGGTEWYQNGLLHRVRGPARLKADGTREWFFRGWLHREDGPAQEGPLANRWYQRGQLHRDNGPAEEYASGAMTWYRHGQLHRDDGPAIVHANGEAQWFRQGIEISKIFAPPTARFKKPEGP